MSKVSLFEDDVLVAAATNVNQGADSEFRYSGALGDTALFIQNLSTANFSWIAVSTRDHDVTLTLTYAGPSVTYTVTAGNPLLVSNEGGGVVFVGLGVANAVASKKADIEVHVYEGNAPFAPPSPAFLILNAGEGITEDPFNAGEVASWTDIRSTTSAPLPFDWSDGATAVTGSSNPTIITSDPEFNGKASVSWSGDSTSLFFSYQNKSSTIFDFMRGRAEAGQDFTVMSILKVNDSALPARVASGIWNTTGSGTTKDGFKGSVEGGYRVRTQVQGTTSVSDIGANELVDKTSVIIWLYDGDTSTMRVYRQGVWSAAINMAHTSSAAASNPFEVGFTHDASWQTTFDGKIADIRVYDRTLDADTYNEYIDMAVDDYGVDDTAEQGFPFITGAIGFHRTTRGVPDSGNTWYDMRVEAHQASAPGSFVTKTASSFIGTLVNDSILNAKSFIFNGVSDSFQNAYNGTPGHLSGASPGFSIGMVYYQRGNVNEKGLFTMEDYNTHADNISGVNIEYRGSSLGDLRYEIDNDSAAVVIQTQGGIKPPDVPRAIMFRTDGTDWWIDEMDLRDGSVVTSTGALAGTPGTDATQPVFLFAFPDLQSLQHLAGALTEVWTTATKETNAEVLEYFTYATRVYGP